jgi:16S rRNA (adenine(1408)-N(1))-methyltransferase
MDLGTGNGRFVLERAAACPEELVIGVDASAASMADASRRAVCAHRKAGRSNVYFLAADVAALPPDLHGFARLVTVHFPWGSLLRSALSADPAVTRLVAPDGWLRLLISASERDARAGGAIVNPAELAAVYERAGFRVAEVRPATLEDARDAHSAWGKRLLAQPSPDRRAWLLVARRA